MFMRDGKPDVQVPYSRLMHGLAQENIRVNRKVLSELAMNEPHSFKALVDQARLVLHAPASLIHPKSTVGTKFDTTLANPVYDWQSTVCNGQFQPVSLLASFRSD
jgi:Ribosomal protein L20